MEAPDHAQAFVRQSRPRDGESKSIARNNRQSCSQTAYRRERERSALWTARAETEDVQRCNAVGREAGLVCFWLLLRIIAAFAGRDT